MANEVKFQIVDRGWAEILSRVSRAGSTRVRAGVLGSAAGETHGDSDITVGEVALINEYGTEHVPPRPFMRITFQRKDKQEAIKRMYVRSVREIVFNGASADQALNAIGEMAANTIKATIMESPGVPPPNAQSTIDHKGTDHTLLATHQMVEAITHDVVHGPLPDEEV